MKERTRRLAGLSHLGRRGRPGMVDVSAKTPTAREATAEALVALPQALARRFRGGDLRGPKGSVVQAAILAGTLAAKRTGEIIPLCHPLPLEACTLEVDLVRHDLRLVCTVKTTHKTGVEMEALTAVAVAALTVYDMCKSAARGIVIRRIRLLSKRGGSSDYQARGRR